MMRLEPAMILLALPGVMPGSALAQDELSGGVLEESWDIEIEMLEPDLDFLLDALETESCYCACDDWCAGTCEGTNACETWCVCPIAETPAEPEGAPIAASEPPAEPAPAESDPPESDPPESGLAESEPPALEPPAPAVEPEPAFVTMLEMVFYGEVSVPTCRCVWRLQGELACNASVDWPADGPSGLSDCDCSRFNTPPGCDGDAQVISVILGAPEKKRRW